VELTKSAIDAQSHYVLQEILIAVTFKEKRYKWVKYDIVPNTASHINISLA
jgi:hypothetical protein